MRKAARRWWMWSTAGMKSLQLERYRPPEEYSLERPVAEHELCQKIWVNVRSLIKVKVYITSTGPLQWCRPLSQNRTPWRRTNYGDTEMPRYGLPNFHRTSAQPSLPSDVVFFSHWHMCEDLSLSSRMIKGPNLVKWFLWNLKGTSVWGTLKSVPERKEYIFPSAKWRLVLFGPWNRWCWVLHGEAVATSVQLQGKKKGKKLTKKKNGALPWWRLKKNRIGNANWRLVDAPLHTHTQDKLTAESLVVLCQVQTLLMCMY